MYEVLDTAVNANNGADLEPVVIYRNVQTRKIFVRGLEEFLDVLPSGAPRFEFAAKLDSQLQLLVETLRINRMDYLRAARENPLFVSHGGNKTHLYVLGDKIAFARSVRIINTTTANNLIKWLNTWTDAPNTGHEKLAFSTDQYVELVVRIRKEVREGIRTLAQWNDLCNQEGLSIDPYHGG